MQNTLLLVDGSSYLYRAFHALPDLRSPDGHPTGAMHGMVNMLRRLRVDYPAAYIACVFDAKGKTFRDDLYPEYKANRAAMPDDLGVQIEPLLETIRAMGWPLLIVDGVEADDVIGTLACEATKKGVRTVVSTGDKDMTQLVNADVTLVNTMSNEMLDEAGVEKKFGVKPERIIDYLTLVGDAIDNIPGVDKVGPKTAVKWLAQYGTLDNVIAHASDIGGAVGENLRKVLDWLPQARGLLTIKCDVELPVKVEELANTAPDTAKLAELFDRFEFKTWRRELNGGDSAPAAAENAVPAPVLAKIARHYESILTDEQLEAWLKRMTDASLTSVDTETTSLDPMQARLVGMSFSLEPGTAAYLPVAHVYAGAPAQLPLERVLARLKPWLEDAERPKLGQNIKYDMHIFANHGVALAGVVHDTLLQSYVVESHKPHDMDNMAERHLGVKTIPYVDVCGKGAGQICFDQVSVERATDYAAEDGDITLQLHFALHPQVEADAKLTHIYR